jgi:hypothetical protein
MMMMIFFGAIGGINLAGETEVLGGNLPRRYFVHKIPHDDPVSNPGPQRWEASDYFIWFVRLLALRPLLAYCASLG